LDPEILESQSRALKTRTTA